MSLSDTIPILIEPTIEYSDLHSKFLYHTYSNRTCNTIGDLILYKLTLS